MSRKADERASEYAGRIFEEEQRQAAAQAEAQAKAAAEERAALWARDDAVRADTQNFQLTLEERKAADRAEREARAEQARERRHRERLGAQGGQGGGGMLVSGSDAERMGLDPTGRYWIDGRTGKPSVIQAPATAADQRQNAERSQATATADAELKQIENVLTRLEGNISESGFGIPGTIGRRQFDADAKSLAVYLKPLIRKPGENWTDNDQANLERLTASLYDPESVNANRFADIRSLIAGRRQALGIEAPPAAGGAVNVDSLLDKYK
jgi:hypothetical protein